MEGLSSGAADLDGDGRVTVDDAYDFVRRRLSDEGVPQNPRKWAFDVEGHIELAFAPPRRRRTSVPRTDAAVLDKHYSLVAPSFREGRVVTILGDEVNLCGRPAGATWEPGRSTYPPVEEELAAYLAERFRVSDAADLPSVAEHVLDEYGAGVLYDAMRDVLDVDYEPNPVHEFLATVATVQRRDALAPPLILNMNYDTALEQTLEATGEPFDVVAPADKLGQFIHYAPDREPVAIVLPREYTDLSLKERAVIVRLRRGVHGTRGLLVTEDDEFKAARDWDRKGLPPYIRGRLGRTNWLFLGLPVRLLGGGRLLIQIWGEQAMSNQSWSIATDPAAPDLRFWRRNRIDAINADLADYAQTLTRHLVKVQPPRSAV